MRVNELKQEKLLAKYKYCYLESLSFFVVLLFYGGFSANFVPRELFPGFEHYNII